MIKDILKHYIFSYIIAGLILMGAILCFKDYMIASTLSSKLLNLFFGCTNFSVFIMKLIQGMLNQFKEWLEEHTFNFNTTNNKTN